MLKAYKKNQDLHIATAFRIFKILVEVLDDKSKERKVAKIVNFGLIYGMTERSSFCTPKSRPQGGTNVDRRPLN